MTKQELELKAHKNQNLSNKANEAYHRKQILQSNFKQSWKSMKSNKVKNVLKFTNTLME